MKCWINEIGDYNFVSCVTYFGDDFMDIFGVGEDENHAGNFKKTTTFW